MIKGFFSNREIETGKSRKVNQQKDPCDVCKLWQNVESPKMDYTGLGEKECLIIGEAPGDDEDEKWEKLGYQEPTQFIGRAGGLLRKELDRNHLNLDRHFWKTNALCCRPPGNRKPTKRELKLCKNRLDKTIAELKPKFIWLVGGSAVEAFYMGRFSNLGINRWRGICIPDKQSNAWVVPLYHPSHVLEKRDEGLNSVFRRDVKNAAAWLDKKPPVFIDFKSRVKILTDIQEVKKYLRNTLEFAGEIAFDYETSGLKPYKKGHKIWSVAVATDEGDCFAFPIDYPHWTENELDDIDELWENILKHKRIKKIAHNMKFEDTWTRQIFQTNIENWHWCTMNVAHLLDERSRFTGLKFQAYINYGVDQYDKEVEKFIRPKSGEFLNRLNEVHLNDLLLYNGMDAAITYTLFKDQEKSLSRKGGLRKAQTLWHKGVLALSDVQENGIGMDSQYYHDQGVKLKKSIDRLHHKVVNGEEAQLFKKESGREMNLRSSKDLKELLFDILKMEPTKFTATNRPSVDKEALAEINIPFTENLTEMRLLDKIRGTYLAQFDREIENGKMHPFFDLHTARTMRGSSSAPNFQNIPVRNELAKKITRSGIIPSPGNQLCEVDYGSIEVRVAACFTQDPVLVDYVNDPSTCMHRDQAKLIFKMTDKQVTTNVDGSSTNLRFYAKNQFVFPEFYGSWYKACTANIWENCFGFSIDGVKVKDHVGMSYQQFENHIKKVEDKFWKRFKVFKEWQESSIQKYKKRGYVEMFFGHRRGGYLTKNKIINTPIQGTAFHLLLWSLVRINEISKKEKWGTKIIGQIHDSILFDLRPEEKDHVFKTVKRVMCEDVREENPWIIVPLEVDFELTGIDRSWYEKKEVSYEG
jgi:uracil-DNA glycosylase family 4